MKLSSATAKDSVYILSQKLRNKKCTQNFIKKLFEIGNLEKHVVEINVK
jgi:hypothetical protein